MEGFQACGAEGEGDDNSFSHTDHVIHDDVDETKSKAAMAKRRKTTITTITLTDDDKDVITKGSELTDMHINFFQQLLRQQFPSIQGLRSSLSPVVNMG